MQWKKFTAIVAALAMSLFVVLATGCGGRTEEDRQRPVDLEEAPGGPDAYPPDFR